MVDELLIKRIRAGDEDASEILVRKYYLQIMRFCRWQCGNTDLAEDLAQETFLKAFKSLDQYRMICGILEPTSGEVLLDGQNIFEMGADYRDLLGYLPQAFGYYPNYSATDYLYYIAALKGIPKISAKAKIKKLLKIVGLLDVSNKKIRTYSGGMKQRLGIAQDYLEDNQ